MKTKTVAISLIALIFAGCAHTGYYQRGYGYTGYGSGYGSSGYTVERYYNSPAPSYYYQPGGSMGFGTYYMPSNRPYGHHDYDHHQDRDRHESWQHAPHRQEYQPSNMHGGDRNRWETESRQHEHRPHGGEQTGHAPRPPHSSGSPMQSIENDLARSRQQFHEMRRNDFGRAERQGHQRSEGGYSGTGGHDRGRGFNRH